jgi:predicted patatin/cPLA2 family phospholipase
MFQVGVLMGAELKPQQFSKMYSLSSGGPVVTFFATGQLEEARRLWIEENATSGFVDWNRLLDFERPCSTRALIEHGCRTLNYTAIPRGKVHISTLRLCDGATIYHELSSHNAQSVLRASCALPWLTEPELLDGDLHVDGGVEYTFPVYRALMARHSKILAIDNRPPDFDMLPYTWPQRLAIFPSHPNARAALGRRAKRYAEAHSFLRGRTHGTDTLSVRPDETLPVSRLTTDLRAVERTFHIGLEYGRANKRRLHRFLELPN